MDIETLQLDAEERMEKALVALDRDFGKLRTGRATTSLVDNIKDPKRVEMALWKIIPPEEGSDLCHRFVEHGRAVCTARTAPHCDRCCLADVCEKNGVDLHLR